MAGIRAVLGKQHLLVVAFEAVGEEPGLRREHHAGPRALAERNAGQEKVDVTACRRRSRAGMNSFGQLHDVGFVKSLRYADRDRATLVTRFLGDDLMRRKAVGLNTVSQRYVGASGGNYGAYDAESTEQSGPKRGARHGRGK